MRRRWWLLDTERPVSVQLEGVLLFALSCISILLLAIRRWVPLSDVLKGEQVIQSCRDCTQGERLGTLLWKRQLNIAIQFEKRSFPTSYAAIVI
jgi:hypothetical protein